MLRVYTCALSASMHENVSVVWYTCMSSSSVCVCVCVSVCACVLHRR